MKNPFTRSALMAVAVTVAALCSSFSARAQCPTIAPDYGGVEAFITTGPALGVCFGKLTVAFCNSQAFVGYKIYNVNTEVLSGLQNGFSGCSAGYGCGTNCKYKQINFNPGEYEFRVFTAPYVEGDPPCEVYEFEIPMYRPENAMTLAIPPPYPETILPTDPCATGVLYAQPNIPNGQCVNPPTAQLYINNVPFGLPIGLTNGVFEFDDLPAAENYEVVATAANQYGIMSATLVIPNTVDLDGCPFLGGQPSTEDVDPETGEGLIFGSTPAESCADVNVSIMSETTSYGVE